MCLTEIWFLKKLIMNPQMNSQVNLRNISGSNFESHNCLTGLTGILLERISFHLVESMLFLEQKWFGNFFTKH